VKQTGLDKLPAVREKLADLVCYSPLRSKSLHLVSRFVRREQE
jgi:hypothetical protein